MDPYQEFLIREMQRLTSRLLACQEEVWRRRSKASLTCPPFQQCAPCPPSYCLPNVPYRPANRFYSCNRLGCAYSKPSFSCLPTQLTPFQSQYSLRNRPVLLPAELTKYEQRMQDDKNTATDQTESKESHKVILSQRESPFQSTNRLANMHTEPTMNPHDTISLHLTAHYPIQNQNTNALKAIKSEPSSDLSKTIRYQDTIFQHFTPLETTRLYKALNMSLGDTKAQQFKNQTSSKPTLQQSNKIVVRPYQNQFKEQQQSKLVVLPISVETSNNKPKNVKMPSNKVNKMVVMPSRSSMKVKQEPKEIVGKSQVYINPSSKPVSRVPHSNRGKTRPNYNIATHFVAASPSGVETKSKRTIHSYAPSFMSRPKIIHDCLNSPVVKPLASTSLLSVKKKNKETILPDYPLIGSFSNKNNQNQTQQQNRQSTRDSNIKSSVQPSFQISGTQKPRPKSYHGPKTQPVSTKPRPNTNVGPLRGRPQTPIHPTNPMQNLGYSNSQKNRNMSSNQKKFSKSPTGANQTMMKMNSLNMNSNTNQTIMNISNFQGYSSTDQTIRKMPSLHMSSSTNQTIRKLPSLQMSSSTNQTIRKLPSLHMSSSTNQTIRKLPSLQMSSSTNQTIRKMPTLSKNTSSQKVMSNTSEQKIITKKPVQSKSLTKNFKPGPKQFSRTKTK